MFKVESNVSLSDHFSGLKAPQVSTETSLNMEIQLHKSQIKYNQSVNILILKRESPLAPLSLQNTNSKRQLALKEKSPQTTAVFILSEGLDFSWKSEDLSYKVFSFLEFDNLDYFSCAFLS